MCHLQQLLIYLQMSLFCGLLYDNFCMLDYHCFWLQKKSHLQEVFQLQLQLVQKLCLLKVHFHDFCQMILGPRVNIHHHNSTISTEIRKKVSNNNAIIGDAYII